MPKNRKQAKAKGAKSLSVVTKNKLGGRKSALGTNKISNDELVKMFSKVKKKDKNKLIHALENRGILLPS